MSSPISNRSLVHLCLVGDKKLEDDLLRWSAEAFPGALVMQFWGMDTALPFGRFDVFIASLTTSTWSRARHVSPLGPAPLRSDAWPYGFPWLNEEQRNLAEHANLQFRHAVGALKEAAQIFPAAKLFFLFPEDLGSAPGGRPASPWQLAPLRRMATELGLLRSAVFQCEFGACDWASPLGILSCPPLRGSRVRQGWPLFLGDANFKYIGPLPRVCSCPNPHRPHHKEGGDDLRRTDGSILSKNFALWLLAKTLHLEPETAGLFQAGSSSLAARRSTGDILTSDTDDATLDPGVSDYEGPFDELDFGDFGIRQEQQQKDTFEEGETRKTLTRDQRTERTSQPKGIDKPEAVTKKSFCTASERYRLNLLTKKSVCTSE